MTCKYILIADYPAPWREKVYEIVHQRLGDDFHVVYCTRKETRRLWKFRLGNHPKTFLRVFTLRANDGERFFSPGIVAFLLKHRPRVLIGFSLYPTVLLGFLLGRILRSKLVVFADSWKGRDRNITLLQKAMRTVVYNKFGDAFLGASRQTLQMFRHYRPGVREESFFLSSLCADNDYFIECLRGQKVEKIYDMVFSGRISAEKNPLFFAEVACRVKHQLGKCRVLILGDGDELLKRGMLCQLEKEGVEYDFPGFVEHAQLPYFYAKAKILTLPTSGDCWGVVLNEAMICGLPVFTTEWTAAAGELVIDGRNGCVLPLDAQLWVERVAGLLSNAEQLESFSECARRTVLEFNFKRAAEGIIEVIKHLDAEPLDGR
jgi:glycosyltransferase involved in cell wall biosynthesis